MISILCINHMKPSTHQQLLLAWGSWHYEGGVGEHLRQSYSQAGSHQDSTPFL